MREERDEGSGGGVISTIGYPRHVESFETYYYLGEQRVLKTAAKLRFPSLVPDCPPSSPSYQSKFESFYTKFRRWAKAEDWNGWCIRKGVEERQSRDKEVRMKLLSLDKTVRTYQQLVRQSLVVWADKVRASIELRTAIAEGDVEKIQEIRLKDRFELKSSQEVRLFMELDMYLSKVLDQLPEVPPDEQERLSEAERERIDKVMEEVRKRALDLPLPDLGGLDGRRGRP